MMTYSTQMQLMLYYMQADNTLMTVVKNLAVVVAKDAPADVEALKACKYPGSDLTVTEIMQEKVMSIGENMPVDVVIRPEDVVLTPPSQGELKGVVTDIIFKGVHYEMHVMANGYEWLVHSTVSTPIGAEVGLSVEPSNIQIMNKPESEDEEVFNADA